MQYFKIDEFKCKCCGKVQMDTKFLERLDEARGYAGVAFVINSGYRCPAHNHEVGSTSDNHTMGLAADIKCDTGVRRLILVRALLKAGFVRIGLSDGFIHADASDKVAAIWLYAKG